MKSSEKKKRGSLGSDGEEMKEEGLYAPSKLRVEEYTYPEQIKSLKYPEQHYDISSTMFDHMFALSARTLIRNLDDFPFFGELSQSFTPLELFKPECSNITFYAGPRYDEEVKTYQIKMAPSRTSKNYIFQLQSITPTLLQLSCYATIFPCPGLTSEIFILLQKKITEEEEEPSFQLQFDIASSTDSGFDFDVLLFDHYDLKLLFMQVNLKDALLEKKFIEIP